MQQNVAARGRRSHSHQCPQTRTALLGMADWSTGQEARNCAAHRAQHLYELLHQTSIDEPLVHCLSLSSGTIPRDSPR